MCQNLWKLILRTFMAQASCARAAILIFGNLRVHRVLLYISFPSDTGVLTLDFVKTRSGKGERRMLRGEHFSLFRHFPHYPRSVVHTHPLLAKKTSSSGTVTRRWFWPRGAPGTCHNGFGHNGKRYNGIRYNFISRN